MTKQIARFKRGELRDAILLAIGLYDLRSFTTKTLLPYLLAENDCNIARYKDPINSIDATFRRNPHLFEMAERRRNKHGHLWKLTLKGHEYIQFIKESHIGPEPGNEPIAKPEPSEFSDLSVAELMTGVQSMQHELADRLRPLLDNLPSDVDGFIKDNWCFRKDKDGTFQAIDFTKLTIKSE